MLDKNLTDQLEKLKENQKKIIQSICDQGFSMKETDYSYGYIRGVEDALNLLYNIERQKLPRF